MDYDQPSYAEAATFWNSLNGECRETLLSGYDGLHPWSLAVQLEEAGMLSETVPAPGDRVVTVAEEGAGWIGHAAPLDQGEGSTGVSLDFRRRLDPTRTQCQEWN